MAHILVYLQRTPQGLHPASAAGLCLARDIGSQRGATVTGVCSGDAGALDRAIVAAASRFGADIVLFGGPQVLENLQRRLQPVHVLTPWTPEGLAAVQGLRGGPAIPRWLERRDPPWGGADTVTGLITGIQPWHASEELLEAEYEGDVDKVPMPPWVEALGTSEEEMPPFQIAGRGPVGYTAPEGLDAGVAGKLAALGAQPVTLEDIARSDAGTYVWLAPGAGRIPDGLARRGLASRLILVPGPDAAVDVTWSAADWVFPGPWHEVIEALLQAATAGVPWQTGPG